MWPRRMKKNGLLKKRETLKIEKNDGILSIKFRIFFCLWNVKIKDISWHDCDIGKHGFEKNAFEIPFVQG